MNKLGFQPLELMTVGDDAATVLLKEISKDVSGAASRTPYTWRYVTSLPDSTFGALHVLARRYPSDAGPQSVQTVAEP